MKNKYLEPEIEIIKLLTEDVVCTSGMEYGNYDEFGEGGLADAGGLS